MNQSQTRTSRAARALTLGYSDSNRGRLALRGLAVRAARLAMRVRSRSLPAGGLASALVLSPHPDDESFGCGGTVALTAKEGVSVHVAFITDGAASHPRHPALAGFDIARLRRTEALRALEFLGIGGNHTTYLDTPDGTLAHISQEASRKLQSRITGLISQLRPEAILLPSRNDGSSEHEAAFGIVSRAIEDSGRSPRVLEFPVWSLWNPTLLAKSILSCPRIWRVRLGAAAEAKARAVQSYASQLLPIPPETTSALPEGFASVFLCAEEYLFEWSPPR